MLIGFVVIAQEQQHVHNITPWCSTSRIDILPADENILSAPKLTACISTASLQFASLKSHSTPLDAVSSLSSFIFAMSHQSWMILRLW